MRRLLFEWWNVLAGMPFTMSCLSAARSTAALGLSGTEAGRWKVGPSGCYWDANDSGLNQCTPGGTTTGRWKQNGSQCYWDANRRAADRGLVCEVETWCIRIRQW